VVAAGNLCDSSTEIINTFSQKGSQFSDIVVSPHRRVVDSQVSQVPQAGKLAIWQASRHAGKQEANKAGKLASWQRSSLATGKLVGWRARKLASWQAGGLAET
jgi:hypothetical protein